MKIEAVTIVEVEECEVAGGAMMAAVDGGATTLLILTPLQTCADMFSDNKDILSLRLGQRSGTFCP